MPPSLLTNPNGARRLRSQTATLSDTECPLLGLKWKDSTDGRDAENGNEYASITIDNNGSDDSFLIVLLNVGPSSTNYTQYQFSAAAAAVADPSGVDASPTHATVANLGAMIAAINLLQASNVGLYATRLHAPADYALNTNDFIDLAEQDLRAFQTGYLFKDASEVLTVARRIGIPEARDHGLMEIVRIVANINSNSATDCVFRVSRDPNDISAADEVLLGQYSRNVPDATITTLWDDHVAPSVVEGPVLFEATATVSMAVDSNFDVGYRSAEL